MFESLYNIINTDTFSFGYNFFIVSVFSISVILYIYKNARLRKSCNSVIIKLQSLGTKNRDTVLKEVETYFWEKNHDILKPVWTSYFERTKKSTEEGIIDPLDFFNSESIINRFTSKKSFDVIPGILVTLGIFGTFLGLTAGLEALHLESGSTDLKDGIYSLISGMKIAFSSSVWGIFCSLLWIFTNKFIILPQTRHIASELENEIDSLLTRPQEQILLENLLRVQRESTEALKTLVSDTVIPEMMNQFGKILNETLVPHMQSNNQLMEQLTYIHADGNMQILSQMEAQTGAFNEFAKNTAKTQMESMDTMVERFMGRMQELSGEHFEALAETLKDTISYHEVVHHNLMELISQLQDTAMKQNELFVSFTDMGSQIEVIGEKLEERSETFIEAQDQLNTTVGHFMNAGDQIERQANKLIELQALIRQSWDTASEEQEHLQSVNEKIREDLEYYLNQMDARVEKITSVWSSTENLLQELNEQLSGSIQSFSEHMHQGLNRTFTQFDDHLSKSLEHLAAGVGSLQEITSEFPDVVSRFTEYVRKLHSTENNSEVATTKES